MLYAKLAVVVVGVVLLSAIGLAACAVKEKADRSIDLFIEKQKEEKSWWRG